MLYLPRDAKGGKMSFESKIGFAQLHPCYMEPIMDEHEIDECERCHNEGEHTKALNWFDVCAGCAKDLEEEAAHATYEFTFTVADVKAAQSWAEANRYRYDDVNHLLHDAMTSGVIHARTWKAA
jgi:hypothetical protein